VRQKNVYKAQKLTKSHNIMWHHLKTTIGWCVHIIWRNRLSPVEELHFVWSCKQTSSRNFFMSDMLLDFTNIKNYIASQIWTADETLMSFSMESNTLPTIWGQKSMMMKIMQATIILTILDGTKSCDSIMENNV